VEDRLAIILLVVVAVAFVAGRAWQRAATTRTVHRTARTSERTARQNRWKAAAGAVPTLIALAVGLYLIYLVTFRG